MVLQESFMKFGYSIKRLFLRIHKKRVLSSPMRSFTYTIFMLFLFANPACGSGDTTTKIISVNKESITIVLGPGNWEIVDALQKNGSYIFWLATTNYTNRTMDRTDYGLAREIHKLSYL